MCYLHDINIASHPESIYMYDTHIKKFAVQYKSFIDMRTAKSLIPS